MRRLLFVIILLLTYCVCYCQDVADKYMSNPSLALNDARHSFKNGDYEKTIRLINIYCGLSEKEDGALLLSSAQECKNNIEKAIQLELQGNYSSAIKCYLNVLKINPEDNNTRSKIDELKIKSATRTPDTSQNPAYKQPSNPPKKSSNKLKPERFTFEVGAIGGSNLGLAMDITASYFLFGAGIDWIMIKPNNTVITNLINSGYTGNFTKTSNISLTGSCTNVFVDLGGYFKYFSVSCQLGLLCGTTVSRNSQYDGSGYGLVDDDINEYWGDYSHHSFENNKSEKELHFTVTPQIKGYIPVGRNKNKSISLGIGYTFIPSLGTNVGVSASLGMHFRFL